MITQNQTQIQKGQIYFADMPDAYGSEQGGRRPVIIIQNNVGNKYSTTTLIAPLTTSKTKHTLPTHVLIKAGSNGLKYDSTVLLEQVRVVDKRRLRDYVTYIDEGKMNEINSAISVSFGLGSSVSA